ncbi:hypothetical protein LUZ60_010705 [Juncus effusus]|nr:hypothetical protein LUZ60_010705 [Juncus effusus]
MGNTILHILCSYGHDVLASMVCYKDRSLLRAHNKMLETPLHCTAMAWEVKTIIKLIEFARSEGESVLKDMLRDRNRHRETALHEAARRNHEVIINELVTVDPELAYEVDNDGVSPLDLAIDRGNLDAVVSITEKLPGKKINPKIHSIRANPGTTHNPIHILPRSVDISKRSPIHRAVLVGNTHMAEFLLDNDASLAYSQDSDGLFPIHVAACKGHLEMVLLFMERYLDSGELLDHRGRNILHIAAEVNNSNILVQLLGESNDNKLPSIWKKNSGQMITNYMKN